ncbi:MAG: hypothetical protein V1863_05345, partial [Candidatus Omnitrophota bacterium]
MSPASKTFLKHALTARPLFLGLLLFLVTIAVFSPCFGNDFIRTWDDQYHVILNENLRSFSPPHLKNIFTGFFIGNYLPLTMLSFAADYHFFQLNPAGYHATSVFLHALNVLLVFWLFSLLTGRRAVAFPTALLFGLHPIQVESVAWVSERKDVLYAFFFLAALVAYVVYLRRRQKSKFYILTMGFFLCSLLSKPMAVTFPLFLFLFDRACDRPEGRRAWLEKIPFFVFALSFSVLTFFAQRSAGALRTESAANILYKFQVALYAVVFYLDKIFRPSGFSCLYNIPDIRGIFLLTMLAGLLLAVLITLFARHSRKVLFGIGFFLLSLLPVLQFVPVGGTVVADRYVYIASIGIFYLLAEGILWLWQRKGKHAGPGRIVLVLVLVFVLGALGNLAKNRCRVWNNDLSLWNDVLAKDPTMGKAYNELGLGFYERNDYVKDYRDV